jgi:hypothetical protein
MTQIVVDTDVVSFLFKNHYGQFATHQRGWLYTN